MSFGSSSETLDTVGAGAAKSGAGGSGRVGLPGLGLPFRSIGSYRIFDGGLREAFEPDRDGEGLDGEYDLWLGEVGLLGLLGE